MSIPFLSTPEKLYNRCGEITFDDVQRRNYFFFSFFLFFFFWSEQCDEPDEEKNKKWE